MKKRYYLRGLGLGILFTSIFFMIGGKTEPTMSDEMIMKRAKELGMIESTVLAQVDDRVEDVKADEGATGLEDAVEETVVVPTEEESVMEATQSEILEETVQETADENSVERNPEKKVEMEEEITVEESDSSAEEKESVEENSDKDNPKKEDTEKESSEKENTEKESTQEDGTHTAQMISIVVNKGEGSDTVSRRLHEAGLVEDPYEFDRYLMQNGYDKRIGAGEHLIPVGASWQEIAKLLTS